MPPPPLDPLPLLQRYAAGFFPMIDDSDPAHPIFFWDRTPLRAILPLTAQTAARARRMARRSASRFTIRYTTAVEQVLRHLRRAKDHSWVQSPVLDIYRSLHAAHLLLTIEAWTNPAIAVPVRRNRRAASSRHPRPQSPIPNSQFPSRPRLVGALLGIPLPGVFIAETMYGLLPDASKICLCQLVQDCHAAHFDFIDVQTPHTQTSGGSPGLVSPSPRGSPGLITSGLATPSPVRIPAPSTPHPCIRLGEQHIPHAAFLTRLHASFARRFPGRGARWLEDTLRAWLAHAPQHSSELLLPSCVQPNRGTPRAG